MSDEVTLQAQVEPVTGEPTQPLSMQQLVSDNQDLAREVAKLRVQNDELLAAAPTLGCAVIHLSPEAVATLAALTEDPAESEGAGDTPQQGDPFFYHKPDEQCHLRLVGLRRRFRRLKQVLEAVCPPSRERSLAITHLQDALFHSIACCVVNDPNSTPAA